MSFTWGVVVGSVKPGIVGKELGDPVPVPVPEGLGTSTRSDRQTPSEGMTLLDP